MLGIVLANIGQDCRARQWNVEMAIQDAKPGLWQQDTNHGALKMRRDGVDVETSRGVCGVEPSRPRQGKLSDWIRPVKKSVGGIRMCKLRTCCVVTNSLRAS
ncbi:Uncharacterized protein HZ326_0477 [Fusarium oxysporum f. sp. albedinis]|nr:Uncharacterized protein HZ326_0477 [Fusarium oxysporum f. sp. albedinis]